MRKRVIVTVVGAAVLLAGLSWLLSRATLSALDAPGPIETAVATRAKRWLIGRAARAEVVPVAGPRAIAAGGMRYRGLCASCHGNDGRTPTDIGRAMSPRAVDLGDASVQSWSDPELFWIIKHGIRLSGMPGFGAMLDDDEIGALVAYVRTIPDASEPPL